MTSRVRRAVGRVKFIILHTRQAFRSLFDAGHYRATCPPGLHDGEDAFAHFVRFGGVAPHDPHPLISIAFILSQRPDLAHKGRRILLELAGWKLGPRFDPHPLFDSAFYLAQRPDVRAIGLPPLVHYLLFGQEETTDPHQLFDARFYRSRLPELANSDGPLLLHYLRQSDVTPDPHPLFSVRHFGRQWTGVGSSLVAYVTDRSLWSFAPNPLFDPAWYSSMRPDLPKTVNPLIHYLTVGSAEGTRPCQSFDRSEYAPVDPSREPLSDFIANGLRAARTSRRASVEGGLFKIVAGAVRSGAFARAREMDRALIGIGEDTNVLSFAGNAQQLSTCRSASDRHLTLPAPVIIGEAVDCVATEATLPVAGVDILHDVRAIGGSRLIIGPEGECVHDELARFHAPELGSKLAFLRLAEGRAVLGHVPLGHLDLPAAANISSDADTNYFHWIVECLPKIALLDRQRVDRGIPLLISADLPRTAMEALAAVAGGRAVQLVASGIATRVRELYLAGDRSRVLNNYGLHPQPARDIVLDPDSIAFVREKLLPSSRKAGTRRFYLRRRSGYRNLVDEAWLHSLLTERGFEAIDMGALTFAEQVAAMQEAAFVIAPTGAALTNICFLSPGARVLILCSDHPSTNLYLFTQIGPWIGAEVAMARGKRARTLNGQYSLHDDFFVPRQAVLEWLGPNKSRSAVSSAAFGHGPRRVGSDVIARG